MPRHKLRACRQLLITYSSQKDARKDLAARASVADTHLGVLLQAVAEELHDVLADLFEVVGVACRLDLAQGAVTHVLRQVELERCVRLEERLAAHLPVSSSARVAATVHSHATCERKGKALGKLGKVSRCAWRQLCVELGREARARLLCLRPLLSVLDKPCAPRR